jgi:hypothetical protein
LLWPAAQAASGIVDIATVGFRHTTPERLTTSLIDARPRNRYNC